MKKSALLFLIFALLIGIETIQAQRDYRFGINLTPSIAWFGNETDNFSSSGAARMGFGLIADLGWTERVSVLTGVNYMGRGARVKNETTGFSQTFNTNYIELPVALKMATAQFDKMTYFAKFGTIIGFHANSQIEFQASGNNTLPENLPSKTLRGTSLITNIFQIGIGAEYELRGGTSLVASIDYNLSYYNNVRQNRALIFNDQSLRFNGVALSLGVIF
jgi:hypothetical protein